jgi:hypothetical protein
MRLVLFLTLFFSVFSAQAECTQLALHTLNCQDVWESFPVTQKMNGSSLIRNCESLSHKNGYVCADASLDTKNGKIYAACFGCFHSSRVNHLVNNNDRRAEEKVHDHRTTLGRFARPSVSKQ